KDIEYVLILGQSGRKLLIAEQLLTAFEQLAGDNYEITEKGLKGSDLAGTIARHPMHHLGGFFAEARPLLPVDRVTTAARTGLVPMAPDHGEEDFYVCKAVGIDPVLVVNDAGFCGDDWAWLPGGGSVINAKFNAPYGPICNDLRETGALLAASADFLHSYPH